MNVPYRTIDDAALADGILGLLESTRSRPESLTLEVVPSGPGAGAELDRQVLERLTRQGIRLSLDDFGRASSLTALRVLPLAEVKIDTGFVRGAGRGGPDDRIIQNLLALAHDLGLETVAEGVETRTAWDALARMGCTRAQGFYLQPPLPVDELAEWLAHELAGRGPVEELEDELARGRRERDHGPRGQHPQEAEQEQGEQRIARSAD